MPEAFSYSATNAKEQAKAYVASILKALGSRDAMEVLAETPDGSPPRRLRAHRSAGQRSRACRKWSVRQVVQHLADSELVGAFRFRMILAHDAPELPGYDQDLWAARLRYEDSDVATALADFATLRQANLRLFRRATPADLKRVMHHAERGDESLEQTIPMYAGHDLVHRAQIRRIRAAIGAPCLPEVARP